MGSSAGCHRGQTGHRGPDRQSDSVSRQSDKVQRLVVVFVCYVILIRGF